MRRGVASAFAIGLASLIAAAPAGAAHHLVKISEVFPGSAMFPGVEYVELQLTSAGENQMTFGSGSSVSLYDAAGTMTATGTFATNPPNGQSQRTILVGTPGMVGVFNVTPDLGLTVTMDTPEAGGSACFNSQNPPPTFGSLDCVAWGALTMQPPGTSSFGTPETSIPDGSSLGRSILANNPTLHDFNDDTNSSANDFVPLSTPTPCPNSPVAPCHNAPPAPSITDSDPDSPSSNDNPVFNGTVADDTTVKLFSNAGCTTQIGSGTAAVFESGVDGTGIGLASPLPANQTTTVRATATDATGNVTPCSAGFPYVEDSFVAPPTITDSDPNTPSASNTPVFNGSVEDGSTVQLFSDAGCNTAIGPTGTAAAFESSTDGTGIGLTDPVDSDQTTTVYAKAIDTPGNVSACSAGFDYVEDSSAPDPPDITDSDPNSPSSNNTPVVNGTVEDGTTVTLYSDHTCGAAPIGTGTAADFESTTEGVGVAVTTPLPADATSIIRATATDQAGNVSACSSGFPYAEDSSIPDADNDGIPDVSDVCPLQAGPAPSGCPSGPPLDSDGDGVTDGTDVCPLEPGVAPTGCPAAVDSDGDGVPDGSDLCPAQLGSGSNSGCPLGGADTTAPKTRIDQSPPDRTRKRTATYQFSSNEPSATFECKLDKKKFAACTSPARLRGLDLGAHSFRVFATDAAGNADETPVRDRFEIVRRKSG